MICTWKIIYIFWWKDKTKRPTYVRLAAWSATLLLVSLFLYKKTPIRQSKLCYPFMHTYMHQCKDLKKRKQEDISILVRICIKIVTYVKARRLNQCLWFSMQINEASFESLMLLRETLTLTTCERRGSENCLLLHRRDFDDKFNDILQDINMLSTYMRFHDLYKTTLTQSKTLAMGN